MPFVQLQPGVRMTAARLQELSRVIERQELTASFASVVFSDIPQTFRDLRLSVRARGTAAGDQVGAMIQMNSVTGSYTHSLIQDFNTFASGSSTGGLPWRLTGQIGFHGGFAPGAGASAGAFGCAEVTIPEYADATKPKMAITQGGYDDGTRHYAVWAQSRNAATESIISLTVVPTSGSWELGTVVTLTGI